MQSLNFEDGLKRLAINGDENRVIVVNPTDVGIVTRYREKLPEIEKLSSDTENSEEIPDILDKKVREFVDYIIGSPVLENGSLTVGTTLQLHFLLSATGSAKSFRMHGAE